jgi:NADPH:quinone reductase
MNSTSRTWQGRVDYRSNVALYPAFQSYFREHRLPLLAVRGRHDPAFLSADAAAYQRDPPDAQVHLLDAGHFALETHSQEVATLMRAFLNSSLGHATQSATER